MDEIIQLSIIIVNYKNPQLIMNCVQSIVDYEKDINYEIIVVDNNSEDDTEQKLRDIYHNLRWFQMGYNSGFGRANNKGIKAAKGKFILLLNSDVILNKPNILSNSLKFLKSLPEFEKIILGIRLTDVNGNYQETLRLKFPGIKKELKANPLYIFFVNRLFKIKNKDNKKQKSAHFHSGYVKWINGAFLLMKRETILSNKLFFDEDFFLYGEDVELAWRVNKKGVKYYHYHKLDAIHIGSATMPKNVFKRSQVIVSDWLYIKKTRGVIYLFFLYLLIFVNLGLDDFLFYLSKIRVKQISDYSMMEKNFRKVYWHLLKKYGLQILLKKILSTENFFFTNCYNYEFIKKKTK